MKRYFIDTRKWECVGEEEIGFLAPELYYEYGYTEDETIVETFRLRGGKKVQLAYNPKLENGDTIELKRSELAKEVGQELTIENLVKFEVPKDNYEETLKHFGLV